MNGSTSNFRNAGTARSFRLGLQASAVLLVAAALGLAYNGNSPLGLRPAAEVSSSVVRTNPAESSSRVVYANQTLALTLEGAKSRPVLAPPEQLPVASAQLPALNFPAIGWPEVKGLLASNQIVLVDVRFKNSYALGHIPGAISFPSHDLTEEEFKSFIAKYPKDTRFVLYCGSETCALWRTLAEGLVTRGGFTNVAYMPGGYMEHFLAEPRTVSAGQP